MSRNENQNSKDTWKSVFFLNAYCADIRLKSKSKSNCACIAILVRTDAKTVSVGNYPAEVGFFDSKYFSTSKFVLQAWFRW